jgi:hypothetical protein
LSEENPLQATGGEIALGSIVIDLLKKIMVLGCLAGCVGFSCCEPLMARQIREFQLAQRESGPQSLTCPEQLADLKRQYQDECKRFGEPPPVCEKACPTASGNCQSKCEDCATIGALILRKTQQCGQ